MVVGKMTGSGVPTATYAGAPRITWTAGVVRMAPPTPNAPAMVPDTNPDRMPRTALTNVVSMEPRAALPPLGEGPPVRFGSWPGGGPQTRGPIRRLPSPGRAGTGPL